MYSRAITCQSNKDSVLINKAKSSASYIWPVVLCSSVGMAPTLPMLVIWFPLGAGVQALFYEVICYCRSLCLILYVIDDISPLNPSCSLHCLQTWPVWEGRRLHPGGQRTWVLSEEDQGQERQIDVQLFDTSIKPKRPRSCAVSTSCLLGWFICVGVFIYVQHCSKRCLGECGHCTVKWLDCSSPDFPISFQCYNNLSQ